MKRLARLAFVCVALGGVFVGTACRSEGGPIGDGEVRSPGPKGGGSPGGPSSLKPVPTVGIADCLAPSDGIVLRVVRFGCPSVSEDR